MIASDAVEHSEDEEPYAGNDENSVKHEILHADRIRLLRILRSGCVDLDQEAAVKFVRRTRDDPLHI
jgi:hypothetical protein